MEKYKSASAFATLGHSGRLAVFRLLARRAPGGVRPQEIAGALDLKPNTLSAYLSALENAGLARSWREGRAVRYSVNSEMLAEFMRYLALDCCGGRPDLCAPLEAKALSKRPLNVLFICSGNAARSIFAEAILARVGGEKFQAFSAGSKPAEAISATAEEILRKAGHDVDRLHPKPLNQFQSSGAPQMDMVVTVCDWAANQERPAWPGRPYLAHWSVPPAGPDLSDAARLAAYRQSYRLLSFRVGRLISTPIETLSPIQLQSQLDAIGQEVPQNFGASGPQE